MEASRGRLQLVCKRRRARTRAGDASGQARDGEHWSSKLPCLAWPCMMRDVLSALPAHKILQTESSKLNPPNHSRSFDTTKNRNPLLFIKYHRAPTYMYLSSNPRPAKIKRAFGVGVR